MKVRSSKEEALRVINPAIMITEPEVQEILLGSLSEKETRSGPESHPRSPTGTYRRIRRIGRGEIRPRALA